MDGVVIGGPAHGQTFDPVTAGPVLVVPVPRKLSQRAIMSADVSSFEEATYSTLEYKLHEFHATDGTERKRWRVWMPSDVKPHMAFEYMISMALKAPKDSI